MKSLTNYITEKMVYNKSTAFKYNYHPKTKRELQDIIYQLIEERGNEGDFNDIDTSQITNMSYLFFDMEDFNGNISNWDVSNVESMSQMFRGCKSFNQDISKWDVSNVTDKSWIFDYCHIEEKYKPKFK